MSDSDAQQPQDFSAFEGTRPVNERLRFDTDALAAWLAAHVDGFAGPLTIEQFAGGQSNPTYKLITPARSYVMRAKPGPAAKLLPSAHAIEREYRVMDALAGTDVPVARCSALCEDECVIGRAFYVMEFVEGRVLWDQSLPGMTPAERGAHLRRDESRDRGAAFGRFAERSASRITASPATTSRGRSGAGASSTSQSRDRANRPQMNSSSTGCRSTFRAARRDRVRSCTATTASTT